MFFQELMLHSKKAMAVDTFVHMYYAAVSGSVTNTISKKFFDKYYRLEIERIPFLKEHNLLETYMEERFNFYIRVGILRAHRPYPNRKSVTKRCPLPGYTV